MGKYKKEYLGICTKNYNQNKFFLKRKYQRINKAIYKKHLLWKQCMVNWRN